MKAIAYIAAILVGIVCIATSQWIYLIYIGAVLFAISGWNPSWLPMVREPGPDMSLSLDQAMAEAKYLIRMRLILWSACVVALVAQIITLQRYLNDNVGMIPTVVATAVTLFLVALALHTEHRRIAVKKRLEGIVDKVHEYRRR